jgi:sigma-E factor negative regulatory protein RseA
MNHKPASPDPLHDHPASWLSALADGQADATAPGCAAWRDDPRSREAWHVYHLIGDVMRSDDLASSPARDASFLAGVRSRLAEEPVVLAPASVPPARRPAWWTPAAAVAGIVAVTGVVLVSRGPVSEPGATTLAVSAVAGDGIVRAAVGAASSAPALVIDGRMVRDAQLDNYLRAHRDMRSGAAAVPGAGLRNVDAIVADR